MSIPLQGFDFGALNDPDFKEDAVREEIVGPILHALGYGVSGPERIVRSRRLEHPYVSLGATQHRVSMVPDYLLLVEDRPTWVLDAKAPSEAVDDPAHHAQVYSYAIHRDIRADWYAICNGREFALYHVADASLVPRFRFGMPDIASRWGEIHTNLWPHGRVHDRGKLDKDLGILLFRVGMKHMTMHFLAVPFLHPPIGRVEDGPIRVGRAMNVEGTRYHVSFDFSDTSFASLVSTLTPANALALSDALKVGPAIVHVTGDLGEANLECALGELEESPNEHFIPLNVLRVMR